MLIASSLVIKEPLRVRLTPKGQWFEDDSSSQDGLLCLPPCVLGAVRVHCTSFSPPVPGPGTAEARAELICKLRPSFQASHHHCQHPKFSEGAT